MRQSIVRGQTRFIAVLVLVQLFASLPLALGVGAQSGIPDIRGSYQVQGTSTQMCPGLPPNMGAGQGVLTIPTQNQQSFSGSVAIPQSTTIVLTGDADPKGTLTGTYTYDFGLTGGDLKGSGSFTGQATGDQIQLSFTGTETIPNFGTCDQTLMMNGTRGGSPTGPSADLSITQTASAATLASGDQVTYTLTVKNAGPNDATSVLVSDATPAGTTFSAATSGQGQPQHQAPGTAGNVVFNLGTVASGAVATMTLKVNVLAPGGTSLVNDPFVVSDLLDLNIKNNSAPLSTPVMGGAVIKLEWDQPPPTAANPTPAPENLRVVIVSPAGKPLPSSRITPQDSCSLVDVNIYKSDQPNVQTIPSNLWETVPPDMVQATMAAAPVGSFYVITNVWNCGGTIVESGPSNQASVPAGPTISRLKVSAKLKAFGSGFSGPVHVFVDGVGFVKKAVVTSSAQIVQKGLLTDGTSISQIGSTKAQIITIQNTDGGVGTLTFKRP